MPKTVILGTARTPFGKMGGALASQDATDLGGHVIEHALERSEVKPDEVQHVVFGQVLQAGQGQVPSAPGPDQGRHPQGGLLRDREQGVRVGHPCRGDRGPGGPRR